MSKKTRSRTVWWIAGIILVAAVAVAYSLWGQVSKPDPSPLLGKWQRSDGGYMLELSEAGPDGQIKAAYFNPRRSMLEMPNGRFKTTNWRFL